MDFLDQILKNVGTMCNGEVRRSLPQVQTVTIRKNENIEESSQESIPNQSTQNSQIIQNKYEKLEQAESEQLAFVTKQTNDYENELNKVEVIKDEKETWSFNFLYSTNGDSLELSDNPTNKLNYYKYGYDFNKDLPIYSHRDEILKAIESNDVIIVEGSTGCGKTTQVPQYILDFNATRNKYCNIIVTQPRRIAAISIGYRVCEERGWKMGEICGYQVGLDKTHISKYTRINYVTIGILMKKLITQSNDLNKYTHIVIDEVHDRELNTDVGLLILKLLKLKATFNWKIILMSATMDSRKFADYFMVNNKEIPIIKCELKLHQVNVYYLDDLIKKFKIKAVNFGHSHKVEIKQELKPFLSRLLRYFDELELENESNQMTIDGLAQQRGSVLIFVPGMEEILDLDSFIRHELSDLKIVIRPLHSDISFEQQCKAWWQPSSGERKVIISTSIAESSITIQDIKYIIDFCLTREQTSDEVTNYSSLKTQWASKSTLEQRKGRTGRVSEGKCYRMILEDFYETLKPHKDPEMLRLPLEKCILDLKLFALATQDTIEFCKNAEPKKLLALSLDVPPFYDIEKSIAYLKEVGALSLFDSKKETINPIDGELTFIGKIMAQLPIDIKLSKLILLGHAFGKLRECIILAAALSQKSIFLKTVKSTFELYKWKLHYSSGTFCDFTAIINAFNVYERKKTIIKNEPELREWCKNNYLDYNQLFKVTQLINDIEKRLAEFCIVSNIRQFNEDSKNLLIQSIETQSDDSDRYIKQTSQNDYILKFILAGAFYPNYFQVGNASEFNAIRSVHGHDPRKCVYLRGDKLNVLYNEKLLDIFKYTCESDVNTVYVDKKAIIEFSNSKMTLSDMNMVSSQRFIEPGVYLAVCFGLINQYKLRLPKVVNSLEIEDRIEDLKNDLRQSHYKPILLTTNAANEDNLNNPFKIIGEKRRFKIEITDVIDFGHFRAMIKDNPDYTNKLKEIQYELKELYDNDRLIHLDPSTLRPGHLICTYYLDYNTFDIQLYRAKILSVDEDGVDVLYVDYGNRQKVDFPGIFKLPNDLASKKFMSIECKLAHIRPKQNGLKEKFANLIYRSGISLEIEIYSIVESILRVHLIDTTYHPVCIKDLNEFCVHDLEYAEKCEESKISKLQNKILYSRDRVFCESSSKNSNYWIAQDKLDHVLSKVKYSYNEEIECKGPESDLRVYCRPITYLNCKINKNLRAKVARDSINYVLLDDQPEKECSRFLIASDINKSENQDNMLTLHNTCLLPKIRGFAALTSLVFTPTMMLRFDQNFKLYTGAICGLGCDSVIGKPLNRDNDIELMFDFKFTNDDLKNINAIRSIINMCIGDEKLARKWMSESNETREALIKLQNRAVQFTEKLLENEREKVDSLGCFNEFEWNSSVRLYDDPTFKDKGLLFRTHKQAKI